MDVISFKEPRALAGLTVKPPAVFLPDEKAGELRLLLKLWFLNKTHIPRGKG